MPDRSLSLSLSLSPVPRSREGESHHRSPLSSLPCRIALSLSLPCLALEKARAATGLLSPLCHAGSLSLSLLSQLHLSLSLSLSRRSWRQLQSSDTDVGAVRDAMLMAVSHHAAAFTDGLQDVNYCHRVTVVGFKLLPERFILWTGHKIILTVHYFAVP
ncbi:unnamed protein product [Brassica napus]|uniref:(rape) hypothetical protein n=1 Tax=Brassica napus TaxID=3708 RepID=A0A816NH82_BRANA|nr:unnamed protein product [Brassica napus]